MSANVDIIVLINVLRQLTLSVCSHICKRLKSQQLCQLHQFSKKVEKRGSIIFVVGKSPMDIMEPILL